MPALARRFKKIFAKDSANNGVFGSAAALAPATSTNPETIESLAAFSTGWEDATEGGLRLPTLEDMQGLKYDTDYHLAYIYENGMQVYNSLTTYYTNNLVREDATGKIWKSLVDNNTGNALVEGANWTLLGDISTAIPATTLTRGTSLLPKQVTVSNGTDADHDLDFTAGNFIFDDGSGQAVIGALTKQFDVTWAAGSNAGGLDTGSLANNTPYYVYEIYNPSTGVADIIATATFGSPTLPSGFTEKRLFSDFFTDGSANIRTGTWDYGNDEYLFKYSTPIKDIDGGVPATTAQIKTISAPASTFPLMSVNLGSSGTGGGARALLFTEVEALDVVPSSSAFDIYINQGASEAENDTVIIDYIKINSSSQLRYRSNSTAALILTSTRGWKRIINQ